MCVGYACGIVNDEPKAKDDGCDAFSPSNDGTSSFLPGTDVCFQLKAGTAGQPSKLEGELKGNLANSIPVRTLKAGGWFVLVASGGAGKKGVNDRLAVLRAEAKELNLPTERIKVLICEQLAAWCNTIPAVSARWANVPEGLVLLDQWEHDPKHSGEYSRRVRKHDQRNHAASRR